MYFCQPQIELFMTFLTFKSSYRFHKRIQYHTNHCHHCKTSDYRNKIDKGQSLVKFAFSCCTVAH
jgi:hypothetical protein